MLTVHLQPTTVVSIAQAHLEMGCMPQIVGVVQSKRGTQTAPKRVESRQQPSHFFSPSTRGKISSPIAVICDRKSHTVTTGKSVWQQLLNQTTVSFFGTSLSRSHIISPRRDTTWKCYPSTSSKYLLGPAGKELSNVREWMKTEEGNLRCRQNSVQSILHSTVKMGMLY